MIPEDGVVAEHDQDEHEEFVEHFDKHAERKESPMFRATKHHLEKELGLGCAICLSQNIKTLIAAGKLPASSSDYKLPSGVVTHPYAWYFRKAGELGVYPKSEHPFESHHYVVEWAHDNDADVDKLNWYAQWQDIYGLYAEGIASGRPPITSPDDDRTQMILCEKHHRQEGEGVHHTPWPAFSAQFVVKDGAVVLEPLGGYHKVIPKK